MTNERVLTTRMPLLAIVGASTIAVGAITVALVAVLHQPAGPTTAAAVPAPPVASPPAPAVPAMPAAALPRAVRCPRPTVRVASATQLTAALAGARPGDTIRLADGLYRGRFVLRRPGTTTAPIHLCGGTHAVLDGAGGPGQVLLIDGASHVRLVGFAVRRGGTGVLVTRSRHIVVQGLTIERVGAAAIRLRAGAIDNLVQGNRIRTTGLRRPDDGAGVDVGSSADQWCKVSACRPDASDRNVIRGNRISGTTAESVNVHEGTSGNEVSCDNAATGAGKGLADIGCTP